MSELGDLERLFGEENAFHQCGVLRISGEGAGYPGFST